MVDAAPTYRAGINDAVASTVSRHSGIDERFCAMLIETLRKIVAVDAVLTCGFSTSIKQGWVTVTTLPSAHPSFTVYMRPSSYLAGVKVVVAGCNPLVIRESLPNNGRAVVSSDLGIVTPLARMPRRIRKYINSVQG